MKRLFAFLFLTASLLGFPQQVRSETIYALTASNQILSFDSATPGSISSFVPVTGLLAGTSLVGIDFRPAVPGQLVGVGQVGTTGTVYTINFLTGAATVVNTIPTLTGTTFGVDFNPVPDALRIVSNTGQNLRIVAGGTGAVNTDTNLNPGTPSVGGAAYANNVPGGVGGVTTLFNIDFVADTLVTQGSLNGAPVSPNTGMLLTVGSLGVNTGELVGFDISGDSGAAFASLTPAGLGSSLYTLNLSTGAATLVGSIGSGNVSVQGLSVLPAVPEPASLSLLSVGLLGLAGYRFSRRK